jgi:hypothetical protein
MILGASILTLAAGAAIVSTQGSSQAFACRVNALDKVERQRQQTLLQSVRRQVVAMNDLTDGIALTFPADAEAFVQLAEWISLERRCCPFLGFALEWKQDDSVTVRLTGDSGVKEFIAAEMGLARAR